MTPRPSQWHKCILCHDSLWKLGLTQNQLLCYLYLSSFCHKPYAISILKMAKVLHMKPIRVKQAIDALIERKMVTKSTSFGRASTFMVIPLTSKTWGQTELGVVPNGTRGVVPNGTSTQCQTEPLTTSLENTFLGIFTEHFTQWTFNRKPIGKKFIFTRAMQTKAVACMKGIHKTGVGTRSGFHEFLLGCGEYLSLSRDVLSPGRDQRALSPVAWLNNWEEQIRLAGIYLEEKEQKITRLPIEEELSQ